MLALIGLLVFSLPAITAAQVNLSHKFIPGTESSRLIESTVVNQFDLFGRSSRTEVTKTAELKQKIASRNGSGPVEVSFSYDRLRLQSAPTEGLAFEFDSAIADQGDIGVHNGPARHRMSVEANRKWKWVMDPDAQEVLEVVDNPAWMASLAEDELLEEARWQFDREYLVAEANRRLQRIPDFAVDVEDPWQIQSEWRMDSGQTLTMVHSYEYAGVDSRDARVLHRINGRLLTASIARESQNGPIDFRRAELNVGESEIEILFDNQSGQIVEARERFTISGTVGFEIEGQVITGQLSISVASTDRLQ